MEKTGNYFIDMHNEGHATDEAILAETPSYDFEHEGAININKTSPVDMRKALIVVNEFKKAGIMFVAVPAMGDTDRDNLYAEVSRRLALLEKQIDSKP